MEVQICNIHQSFALEFSIREVKDWVQELPYDHLIWEKCVVSRLTKHRQLRYPSAAVRLSIFAILNKVL